MSVLTRKQTITLREIAAGVPVTYRREMEKLAELELIDADGITSYGKKTLLEVVNDRKPRQKFCLDGWSVGAFGANFERALHGNNAKHNRDED